MVALDFGKLPTLSNALEMLKAAADVCHQSTQNALLIKYPSKVKGANMKAHLNNVRKLEDAMLMNGLNIELTYTALLDTSSFHGNDSREGVSRLRLCISDNFELERSPWAKCQASSNHMMVDKVPVVSHRDMKHIPHADTAQQNENLTAAERTHVRPCSLIL